MLQKTKNNEKHPIENVLRDKNGYSVFLKTGDIVDGEIMEKKGSRVYVDLGSRGTGIIYGREYYEAQGLLKGLSVGDKISGKVVDPDNEEGYVEISIKEAGRERNWAELKHLVEAGETVTVKIQDVNKGGLLIEYKNIAGFMPVSQLSSKNYPRVPGGDKQKIYEELKKFVNTDMVVKIIDANQAEGKLIFSEKSNETAKIKEKLSRYKPMDVIEGEVVGIVNFGAFVKFGDDLEGLVHISEIDWQLIENPADVLKVGDKVRTKIIDMSSERVSLSLKALKEDPWIRVPDKYKKGDVIKGVVTKLNPFGAFVKLDGEIQGLLHISEFGNETRMKEYIEPGKEYEFKILSIEPKEHRLALGLIENHPVKSEVKNKPHERRADESVTEEEPPEKPAEEKPIEPPIEEVKDNSSGA